MNRLSVDSLLSIGVRVLGGLSTYLLTIVVAQILEVEDAGAFFLGLSTILFLTNFSQLGLDLVTLKYTGIYHQQNRNANIISFTRTNVLVVMVFSSVVAACMLVFNMPLSELFEDTYRLSAVFRYLSPVIPAIASLMIVGMFLQGIGRPLASILVTKIYFPSVLIISLLLFSNPSLTTVSKAAATSSLTVLFVTYIWWFVINRPTVVGIENIKPTVGYLVRSASTLWAIRILSQALLWLPQIFVGMWMGTVEVAQLSIALRTSMLVGVILVSVNMIVAPLFASHHDQGNVREFRSLFRSTLRLSLGLATPIITLLFLLSPYIVLLFGDDYFGASVLLKILLFGELVSVLCGSVGYALIMSGNEKDLRNSALLAFATLVLLCFFLLGQYGVLGVTIAYSISITVYNLSSAYWVNRRLGFNPMKFW